MTMIAVQPAWMESAKWRPRLRPAFLLALLLHLLAWITLVPLLRKQAPVGPEAIIEITFVPPPVAEPTVEPVVEPAPEPVPDAVEQTAPVVSEPAVVPEPVTPPLVESVEAPPPEIIEPADSAEILSHLQRFSLDSTPTLDLLTEPETAASSYRAPVQPNLLTELDWSISDMPGQVTVLQGLEFYPFGVRGDIARAWDTVAQEHVYKTRYGTEVTCGIVVGIPVLFTCRF